MGLFATLLDQFKALTLAALAGPLLLIPFIAAEQLRPLGRRPRFGDYGLNILVNFTTLYLSLPFAMAAAACSARIRLQLPCRPIGLSFHSLAAVPAIGPGLEIVAMIFIPLVLRDLWFYWAHRIEHQIPALWAFHKLHHSDELMNASTFARDHFLQAAWIAIIPAFSLGLLFDLSLAEAGQSALLSTLFLTLLSMFYHSALRVRLGWLDLVLVTPQAHRIHHSTDPAHYNRNFADALPIFDILFGTYHRPAREEFPATGLGDLMPAPRSIWAAQFGPAVAAARLLRPVRGA